MNLHNVLKKVCFDDCLFSFFSYIWSDVHRFIVPVLRKVFDVLFNPYYILLLNYLKFMNRL